MACLTIVAATSRFIDCKPELQKRPPCPEAAANTCLLQSDPNFQSKLAVAWEIAKTSPPGLSFFHQPDHAEGHSHLLMPALQPSSTQQQLKPAAVNCNACLHKCNQAAASSITQDARLYSSFSILSHHWLDSLAYSWLLPATPSDPHVENKLHVGRAVGPLPFHLEQSLKCQWHFSTLSCAVVLQKMRQQVSCFSRLAPKLLYSSL